MEPSPKGATARVEPGARTNPPNGAPDEAAAGAPHGRGGDAGAAGEAEGVPPWRRYGGPVEPEALRVVKVLEGLSDEDLAWLAAQTREVVREPGELLFAAGDPPDALLLVLEGTVHARRDALGPDAPVFVIAAGEVTGMLPFSRMTRVNGTGRAVTHVRAARIGVELFPEMLRRIPVLEQRFVGALADRVREATRLEEQREKLVALGKLSAGLAHELNNPATAVSRSAAELRQRLAALERLTAALTTAGVGTAAASAMGALRHAGASPGAGGALGALERGEREDRVAAYLEGLGVSKPWLCAPTFVDAGLDVPALEEAMASVPPAAPRQARRPWPAGEPARPARRPRRSARRATAG